MRYSEFTPYDHRGCWLQGLGVTVGLFLVTSLIGLVVGVLWGVVRFYRIPVLMQVVTFVSEILKNSPVLVQLFLVFFGFPAFFHVNVTPVHRGDHHALGQYGCIRLRHRGVVDRIDRPRPGRGGTGLRAFSRWQVLRHVIAPQAAAFSIGPLTRAPGQPAAGHLADLGHRRDRPRQDRRQRST
jgi:His/Glu/Gln/Arg/opine family amino acid ABC transporter permease subunit